MIGIPLSLVVALLRPRGALRPPPIREQLETVWHPEPSPDPALSVPCPRCMAEEGSPCVTVGFDRRSGREATGEPRPPHRARRAP